MVCRKVLGISRAHQRAAVDDLALIFTSNGSHIPRNAPLAVLPRASASTDVGNAPLDASAIQHFSDMCGREFYTFRTYLLRLAFFWDRFRTDGGCRTLVQEFAVALYSRQADCGLHSIRVLFPRRLARNPASTIKSFALRMVGEQREIGRTGDCSGSRRRV